MLGREWRYALWHALHTTDFRAAITDTSRGSDADSNGAAIGAPIGALHGTSSIPADWRDTVLAAQHGGPLSPFSTWLHSKALRQLAPR